MQPFTLALGGTGAFPSARHHVGGVARRRDRQAAELTTLGGSRRHRRSSVPTACHARTGKSPATCAHSSSDWGAVRRDRRGSSTVSCCSTATLAPMARCTRSAPSSRCSGSGQGRNQGRKGKRSLAWRWAATTSSKRRCHADLLAGPHHDVVPALACTPTSVTSATTSGSIICERRLVERADEHPEVVGDRLGVGRRAGARVADVGVHARGDEHAHPDAGAVELVAQRLGQSDDRVLGRAVGPEAGRRHEARARAGVHDVALALLDHAGHEAAEAVGDAEEVDAHEPAEVLVGEVPDAPDGGDAGVVAEQVHRAERVEREVGELLHLRRRPTRRRA